MYTYEDIRTIHLEVTQNCQAACPMCDRNCNGEGVNPHIKLLTPKIQTSAAQVLLRPDGMQVCPPLQSTT